MDEEGQRERERGTRGRAAESRRISLKSVDQTRRNALRMRAVSASDVGDTLQGQLRNRDTSEAGSEEKGVAERR